MPQEEDAPAAKEPRSAGSFALWLFGSVLLYVLSIGPVVRLMHQGKISEGAVEKTYAPILWLFDTAVGAVVLEPFFRWYGGLWGW